MYLLHGPMVGETFFTARQVARIEQGVHSHAHMWTCICRNVKHMRTYTKKANLRLQNMDLIIGDNSVPTEDKREI